MIILDKKEYTIYISEKEDATARGIPGFVYAKQIHGDSLYVLDERLESITSEHDWIISKITDIKIWVLLADCNGIVIMWKTWYSIVHAWRKWLKNDIVVKALHTLEKYGENMDEIKVYIGPSIRECCYEVGEEFLGYFDEKYFVKRDWKLYLDMIAILKETLHNTWILLENIEINQYCTCCSWKFFSYRNNATNERIVVAVEKKE